MPRLKSMLNESNESQESDTPDTAGAGPVTEYLVGDFEWYRPRGTKVNQNAKSVISLRKNGLGLSASLGRQMVEALGDQCSRLSVGLDIKRHLLEIRPDPSGLKVAINPSKAQYGLGSARLVAWLRSKGIPDVIDARYQPETQSVVGRYVPVQPKAEATTATADRISQPATASAIIESGGHRWQPCSYTGSGGGKVYRCEVCGYHTSDPSNPVLAERPCKPDLYEGRYEVKDGKVYPKNDAGWRRPGTGNGGGRRKVRGDETEEGTQKA